MKNPVVMVIIVIAVALIAFFIGQNTRVEQPQAEKAQVEKKVTVTFPGAEKHEISLADAKMFIQNHQKSLLAMKAKTPGIRGGSFERGAIDKILAQPGCNALRIYYGKDEKGKPNLVLVGVDTAGKEMMKMGMVMEKSQGCPPFCD